MTSPGFCREKGMKRAFTLVELIFVIVVIAILAGVVAPRLQTDSLIQARRIFIDTLRYAQHLAMVDDKYTPSTDLSLYSDSVKRKKDTKFWFKKWWMFYISSNTSHPVLVVFSDTPSANGSNQEFNNYPYYKEVANEASQNKKVMGKSFNGAADAKYVDKSLDLLDSYGIKKVVIHTPCPHNKTRLAFDELGRPHCVQQKSSSNATPYKNILNSVVTYTLCKDEGCEENASVCVVARTGYIHSCN